MSTTLLWLLPVLVIITRFYIRNRHRRTVIEDVAHVEEIHQLHVAVMPQQRRISAEPRHRKAGRHRAES